MKTPSHLEIKLAPTGLTEATKQQLLHESGRRYMWSSLPEPVLQLGHKFAYVVFPIRFNAEGFFEHNGECVLCQTEPEAKESAELLTEAHGEHIGIMQSAGFGIVGKVRIRRMTTEHSVRYRQTAEGKRDWSAWEREIDKATGEVKVHRRQDARDEQEAKAIAQQWLDEYHTKRRQCGKAVASSNRPVAPPVRCHPLTVREIKQDVAEAKSKALKRQWPHCFEAFEKKGAFVDHATFGQACLDAYLLDLVEQGYDPKDEVIRADLPFVESLAKAAKKFRRHGKKKSTDLAIYLIAFNYELGWCYLSDKEIAKKLGELLNTSFTAGQVEQYRYRTLGLVSKHKPGPSPKVA